MHTQVNNTSKKPNHDPVITSVENKGAVTMDTMAEADEYCYFWTTPVLDESRKIV